MQKFSITMALASICALSACDALDTDLERGIVGAGFGCVAGEILINGACVPGAIAGGVGGVLLDDI